MTVEAPSTYWIGLDDTDEREYGCTTHDFDALLNHLTHSGFQIHDPRLVRLWPFAPRRTRGNAALSASVVTENILDLEASLDYWFNKRFLDTEPGIEPHSAQPVLLLAEQKLPESFYWNTVQGFVELSHRISELHPYPHRIWSTRSGMAGLIGASAAIAWRGEHDFTWECTAWRDGLGPRNVPESLVSAMSSRFPSTILNRDPNAGRSLIAPRTPCPVLYGIRGETCQGVLDAHTFLQENGVERSTGHRAHRTNQATDDHLRSVECGVVKETRIMRGGHVEIGVGHTLLSFSQGGDVNMLAQQITPGDRIEWFGLADHEGTIHLERLRLMKGERDKLRPNCRCGTRYKSQGQNQPLRCPSCGSVHENVWMTTIISTDWKEPPPSYRRHLAKPLSRMGKSED